MKYKSLVNKPYAFFLSTPEVLVNKKMFNPFFISYSFDLERIDNYFGVDFIKNKTNLMSNLFYDTVNFLPKCVINNENLAFEVNLGLKKNLFRAVSPKFYGAPFQFRMNKSVSKLGDLWYDDYYFNDSKFDGSIIDSIYAQLDEYRIVDQFIIYLKDTFPGLVSAIFMDVSLLEESITDDKDDNFIKIRFFLAFETFANEPSFFINGLKTFKPKINSAYHSSFVDIDIIHLDSFIKMELYFKVLKLNLDKNYERYAYTFLYLADAFYSPHKNEENLFISEWSSYKRIGSEFLDLVTWSSKPSELLNVIDVSRPVDDLLKDEVFLKEQQVLLQLINTQAQKVSYGLSKFVGISALYVYLRRSRDDVIWNSKLSLIINFSKKNNYLPAFYKLETEGNFISQYLKSILNYYIVFRGYDFVKTAGLYKRDNSKILGEVRGKDLITGLKFSNSELVDMLIGIFGSEKKVFESFPGEQEIEVGNDLRNYVELELGSNLVEFAFFGFALYRFLKLE